MPLHELDLLQRAWNGSRLSSRVFRWTVYLTGVAFVLGFLNRSLDRYRDGPIEQVLLGGTEIIPMDGGLFLGFFCREEWSNYMYDLDRQRLVSVTAQAAEARAKADSNSLSNLFPVTPEQLSGALGLVGGGLGMPWLLERTRSHVFGFGETALGVKTSAAVAKYRHVDIVVGIVTVIVIPLGGYAAGAYAARSAGLDVDCHGAKLQKKLAMPATWRALVGTAFAHGYAYLKDCIQANQRRIAPGLMLDYAEVGDRPELRTVLAQSPSAQKEIAAVVGRNDPCVVHRKVDWNRPEILAKNTPGTPLETDDYANCWTAENIRKIIANRNASAPLVLDAGLSNKLIRREFSGQTAGDPITPSVSDALSKALARLAAGHLVNEAGETTVGADDLRLLVSMRQACEAQSPQTKEHRFKRLMNQ